jgi:hypothetical protein
LQFILRFGFEIPPEVDALTRFKDVDC